MKIAYTAIMAVLLFFSSLAVQAAGGNERVSPVSRRLEMKADRLFIKGDYRRAMTIYEQAGSKIHDGSGQKLRLNLKMARLYTLLQQPRLAISAYDRVYQRVDTMLTINDVCFFLDALRQNEETQKAEIVARNYAFKSPYSRNQRYLNILQALSNQQHYYNKGDSDYAVTLLEKNGPLPEYWVGKWAGQTFYAISHSPLQDPLKIYYHRTQYFSFKNEMSLIPFKSIPRELQSGPVTFSPNMQLMIATGISYRNTGRIINPGQDRSMYVTQLYYSVINPKSGGWHRFIPLSGHQDGTSSYAHPAFTENGKSLIFSSDCPGGYGGMDLYRIDWMEAEQRWSDPVNLGNLVNTEGDEIYPQVFGDNLYFSSNGQEGYGGYDICRITFTDQQVVPGTLFHYAYPINTAHNDFGLYLDGEVAYFISDRRGASGKDDIYTFDHASTALGRDDFIGVSKEHSAMTGKLSVVEGLNSGLPGEREKELIMTPTYRIPAEGELLLSIYFDFNSHSVDPESIVKLNALITDPGIRQVEGLEVVGYADEFGSQFYNQKLSTQRARAVADILQSGGIPAELYVEGRGKLILSAEELRSEWEKNRGIPFPASGELKSKQESLSVPERIRINRKARRVDIIVKEKQTNN